MLCPSCGEKTRVVETRVKHGKIRRRRACTCGCRFTSIEITLDEYRAMRRATVPAAAARFRDRAQRAIAILNEADP